MQGMQGMGVNGSAMPCPSTGSHTPSAVTEGGMMCDGRESHMLPRLPALLALTGILCGCDIPPPTPEAPSRSLDEEQAVERVWHQPQIARAVEDVRAKAARDVRVVTMYEGEEQRDGRRFHVVRLAENHPTHLATLAWFLVDARTGEVLYRDPGSDTLLAVDQWEQLRSTRRN